MAKAKKKSTASRTSAPTSARTSAPPPPPPPPKDFEAEQRAWEAQEWRRGRYEWLNRDRSKDAAELTAQIRHEEQVKGLREIREAVVSAKDQPPPVEPQKPVQTEKQQREPDTPTREPIWQILEGRFPPDGKAPSDWLLKQVRDVVYEAYRNRKKRCPDRKTVDAVIKDAGRK